jgi:hypothetical protein
MDRPPSRPAAASAAILTLLLLLAACAGGSPTLSAGGPQPGGGEPTDAGEGQGGESEAGEPTPGTSLTACQIITAVDIEAALDLDPGTVSEGALEEQPTVLDPATNECRYQDESWGGLVVHVTPTDGVNTFDALVSVYGDQAEELDIGDGGLWFEDNDRGYFLQGSVSFFLQFTFIVEPTDSFRDPTVELGEVGVSRL